MVGTVAERKIRCPSFELKEQMLFAEVAPVSVIKLNSFHLQGIEITGTNTMYEKADAPLSG